MKQYKISLYILSILALLLITYGYVSATVNIPGGEILREPSIDIPVGHGGDPVKTTHDFLFRLLGLAKFIISGIALIYLVMIGVYMIAFSDSEERIKKQKTQIIYMLTGFLFLNVPSAIYTIFQPGENNSSLSDPGNPTDIKGGTIFWNTSGFDGFLGDIIGFLRIFLFAIAILMFTWGLFQLIISRGDDEKSKNSKHQLTYGLMGLVFLGFVEGWSHMVAQANWGGTFSTVANKLFGLTLYFAAPAAVFFLILGAYYYITSGGDEERVKKGKAIFTNTLIATIILIAGMSFMNELINFSI